MYMSGPKSDVQYIPRCLCTLTLLMRSSFNIKGGELFEKIISEDLSELNFTFHLSAQVDILARSLFKISAVWEGSLPEAKREVSSANIKMSLSMSLVMSIMYIIKSKGPSLLPCGIPAFTISTLLFIPSTTVVGAL